MRGDARRHLHAWVDRWWRGEAGATGSAANAVLAPMEWAYSGVTRVRNTAFDRGWAPRRRATIPVISVGNLAVGGSGKTPFTAWLVRHLAQRGRRPAVCMRGFGADEALLHRELNPDVPVFAAAERFRAVEAAAQIGRDCAVLDDGFQHRRLARDLDLVLVSAEGWTPTRRLLPRGPWRESVAALGRADLVVLVRKTEQGREHQALADLSRLVPRIPLVCCAIQPDGLEALHTGEAFAAGQSLVGVHVLAVASLADPRSFAEHLREMGAAVELAAFPDHHPFSGADAAGLLKLARGRPLIMTGKDAVKLRGLYAADVQAYVLRQHVSVSTGGDLLDAALRRVMGPL